VSVRDAEPAQTGRQSAETGVVIERVQPDSPAEKAGLKAADVIVEFDGERVRSARQFARLVSETSPGRTVTTTIVRDGRRQNLDVVPDEGSRDVSFFFDGPRLRAQVDDAARALRRFDGFNFDFDSDRVGGPSGPRLGVTVTELPPQLAAYFGVEDGVLITSVGDNSPASRAGLKAGDVVRSVDGTAVRSTPDLVRALRDAEEEVTLAIVRDKKEMTVKATPEPRRPRAPARPV
jgi:serine protease Do